MRRGAIALLALCLVIPAAAPVLASSSQAWVLRNRSDFQDVKLDGAALSPDGSFRLSARVTTLLDAAQPHLWCLAKDSKGRIYAGGGNEGQVFRIDPGTGDSKLFFDAAELQVQSLAVDSRDRVWAATSPRGKVYLVEESGAGTIVFDPPDLYIWAIAFDGRGRLHVATGQKGRVYRIDEPRPNAPAVTLLDGREDHIRSLVRAADGSLYAGSDQNGILYRIPQDGPPSVVYDSPMTELAALVSMGDAVYAAGLSPAPRQRTAGGAPSGGVTRIRVTADDPGGEPGQPPAGEEEQDQTSQRPPAARAPAPESYIGAVFRITHQGYARKIWESREAIPLSLAPAGEGRLLVGTGNEGRVLVLDDAGDVTDFVSVHSQQVNALLPDKGDGFIAAASNLGLVARISPGAAETGTVTSKTYDAGFTSTWGALTWAAEVPKGGQVTFQVRTGNTESPDDSWSEWSPDYTDPAGSVIERPRARYLQWRARLEAPRGAAGPILRSVQINYLQDNLPPEITVVEVQEPGLVLSGSGGGGQESGEAGSSAAARRAQNQPRRSFEKGKRSASWKTEDANNDVVKFEVQYKAEDETLWKTLAHDVTDEFATWDSTAMPDGVYRIRVVATDAPSNPPGAALTGSRTSLAFDVDNTPPQVGPVEARLSSRSAEIVVTVTDSFSVVGDVAYSLDAGEWITVLPEDRIADAMKESYRFRTPELEPGEHTVTVRARDRAGNSAAGKAVIRVPK